MQRNGQVLFGAEWQDAEETGRASLQAAADGFNWLADVCFDYAEDLVDVASYVGRTTTPQSVDVLADRAHTSIHTVGELVGGLFGCKILYENDRWFDQCIVALSHLRFGNSVGMTVRFECSVCRKDPGDCEHEPGEPYPIIAEPRADGSCSICKEHDCSAHLPGMIYQVTAESDFVDPEIREISWVGRPRDPLARISGRSMEDDYLLKKLGRMPKPGDLVLDHACMFPCLGFREFSGGI